MTDANDELSDDKDDETHDAGLSPLWALAVAQEAVKSPKNERDLERIRLPSTEDLPIQNIPVRSPLTQGHTPTHFTLGRIDDHSTSILHHAAGLLVLLP